MCACIYSAIYICINLYIYIYIHSCSQQSTHKSMWALYTLYKHQKDFGLYTPFCNSFLARVLTHKKMETYYSISYTCFSTFLYELWHV